MKFFDSLQNRIIFLIAASYIGVMLISGYLISRHLLEENINAIQHQQMELLNLISDNAEKEFSYAAKYISEIALVISRENLDNPQQARLGLQSVIKNRIALRILNSFSYGFFILDKKGRLVADQNTNSELIGQDFSDTEYFTETIRGKKGIISSPIRAHDQSHPPVIIFTAPITGPNGVLSGVLCGGMILSKEYIVGEMMSYTFNGNGYMYLLNGKRELIMHPDQRRIMEKVARGKNLLLDRAVDENFEGSGETVNSLGIPMVTSFKKNKGTDFIAAANYYKKNIYSQVYSNNRFLFLFGLSSGSFFLFGIFFIIKKTFSPLAEFIENLSGIGGPGDIKKVKGRGSAEIIRLYESYNEMAEKLSAAYEASESANKAKSLFLAKMSHEIRTPMNAIIGMTDLAIMTAEDSERYEYLTSVKESSSHLLEVINDVLDYSKIEAGAVTLEKINFRPYDVIRSISNIMSFKAVEKNLYINLEASSGLQNLTVAGDPHRFKQVLFNLIGNAVKFTNQGGITVNAKVKPRHENCNPDLTNSDGQILLSVSISDTGIGIPHQRLDSIFGSFIQADMGTTREFGGSGLGLSISKEIVEMMNGTISVESVPGEGSVFSVMIPFEPAEENYSPDLAPVVIISDLQPDKKLKILLAEDNPVNIKLAGVALRKLGHDVVIAVNGAEAIERVRENSFDAVLMDIEMPVMDGIEAAAKIRRGDAGAENSGIPIIAMTAHSLREMKERAAAVAINAYISKPIKIEDLNKIINMAIDDCRTKKNYS